MDLQFKLLMHGDETCLDDAGQCNCVSEGVTAQWKWRHGAMIQFTKTIFEGLLLSSIAMFKFTLIKNDEASKTWTKCL